MLLLQKNLAFSLFEKKVTERKKNCVQDEKDKFDFNEQERGCWVYPSANDLGNIIKNGIR